MLEKINSNREQENHALLLKKGALALFALFSLAACKPAKDVDSSSVPEQSQGLDADWGHNRYDGMNAAEAMMSLGSSLIGSHEVRGAEVKTYLSNQLADDKNLMISLGSVTTTELQHKIDALINEGLPDYISSNPGSIKRQAYILITDKDCFVTKSERRFAFSNEIFCINITNTISPNKFLHNQENFNIIFNSAQPIDPSLDKPLSSPD